jgi:bifunctional lysine-specific demethylase and histidyl-hydroxylase NO66
VERLVSSPATRFPAFRLVRADAELSPSDYTTDLSWRPVPFRGAADVARVWSAFADGATIVAQALHLHREPLALFCRDLERELGHSAQANAYYTPRGSQGLPVHHDTHDVLCLQVSGTKRWLVYEPVLELPLREQRYSPRLGRPGPVVLDVTLGPGDTLYLPRGWLHQALTSHDHSLHLTVGIHVYTWLDAVRAAVARCGDDLSFRRGVHVDAEPPDDLLDRLAQQLTADAVAAARRSKLVRSRRPILFDQARQVEALETLTPDSEVERRPTVLFALRPDGETVTLEFEGKRVFVPARAREELEALAALDDPAQIRELPGRLEPASRLVLVRRLVREGFLRVAGTE